MSAMAASAPPARSAGTPMHDLVAVELRKLVDTRAGLWLNVSIATLVTLSLAASLFNPYGISGVNFLTAGSSVAALVLPLTAILSLTSEWAHGSVMSTFALVPRRSRVVRAKLLALGATSVLTVLAVLLTSAVAVQLTRMTVAPDAPWGVTPVHAATMALAVVLSVLMGAAFGAALDSPALAVGAYVVIPLGWTALAQGLPALRPVAAWLDTSATFSLLLQGNASDPTAWAQVVVSTAVWVALPLAVGLARLARREIK